MKYRLTANTSIANYGIRLLVIAFCRSVRLACAEEKYCSHEDTRSNSTLYKFLEWKTLSFFTTMRQAKKLSWLSELGVPRSIGETALPKNHFRLSYNSKQRALYFFRWTFSIFPKMWALRDWSPPREPLLRSPVESFLENEINIGT